MKRLELLQQPNGFARVQQILKAGGAGLPALMPFLFSDDDETTPQSPAAY
jgi:hypothetical protein